ncbi:MAG: MFS transporter [Candidatus Magasanikiibacteriota bacterium]
MIFNRYGIKSNNIILLCIIHFLQGLMFFLPILALYYQKTLFSAQNVALIFAIEAICSAIFEVPTGAIADLFGKKKTMIVAYSIDIIAFIILWIGDSMAMFVIYAILTALAHALNNGPETAIMYDTLKQEGKENLYKKISGIYMAIWPAGAAISSIVGGYLATISLRTPIFYTIFPFLIALIIIFFIDEPPYEKKADATLNGHMLESTKDVLKNKQLMFILLGGIVAWSFGESTHFLSQLFFQFKNIPILWFGYATAAEFALSSLGFYFSHAISERFGNKRTVIMSVILLALLLIFATWTTGLTMLILFSTSSFFFGLRSPILGHLWNEECESRKRATMNSINALVYQLGVAIVIPIVGYWSDLFSVSTAFLLSGLIILIIPPIFFAFLKNN